MPYASKVVGYAFKGDNYCPNCILVALMKSYNDEPYAQIAMNENTNVVDFSTELNLDYMAAALDIYRYNEATFDSNDFPKPMFAGYPNETEETCTECGEEL